MATSWHGAAQRLYGWSETEALTMNIAKLIPENLRNIAVERIRQISQNEIMETHETKRITKDGVLINIWLTATGLVNQEGEVYAIATTERHNNKSESET